MLETLLDEKFEGGVLGGDAVTKYEGIDSTPQPGQNIGFTYHTVSSGGPGISDAPIFVAGRTGLGVTDNTSGGGRAQTLQFVVTGPSGLLYVSCWYRVTDSMTAATYRMVEVRDDDGRFVSIVHNPFNAAGAVQAQITGRATVSGPLPMGSWVRMEVWYDPAGTARVKVGDGLDTGEVPAPVGRDVSSIYFVVTNGNGTTYTLDDVLVTRGVEAEPAAAPVTYRRTFPRDAPRTFPRSKSVQSGNRTFGGYL